MCRYRVVGVCYASKQANLSRSAQTSDVASSYVPPNLIPEGGIYDDIPSLLLVLIPDRKCCDACVKDARNSDVQIVIPE